jgi:aspartate aminotransferase
MCIPLHFGRALEGEENFYIRLAYSGINMSEIKEGLSKFKTFIED